MKGKREKQTNLITGMLYDGKLRDKRQENTWNRK